MKKGAPSRSAENTAFARACEFAEKPADRICHDPYAKYFLPLDLYYIYSIPFFRYRLLSHWELFFPGVVNSILARSRFIDDQLERFMDDGMEQLVVLGAGFDTRAWRFEKLKEGIPVFEIDHADTQKPKEKTLKKIFHSIPEHFHFVSLDLEKSSLEEKLFETGYDPESKTFFIWEGVSYYLASATAETILSFVGNRSRPGSRIVFDYFPPSVADGTCDLPEAKALVVCLKRMGEKIVSGIEPKEMSSLLSKRGLSLEGNFTRENYKRAYFTRSDRERPLSGLFHFAVARVAK